MGRARARVAPPRRALVGAARPRRTAAHRRAARQHRRVPVLARCRGADPIGDRRHQRDVPGRGARAADRLHRLPGRRHLRRVRRPARRRAEPRARRPRAAHRHPSSTPSSSTRPTRRSSTRRRSPTTSTSSSSPRDRPGSRRRCGARRVASPRTGVHVKTVAELGPGKAVYAPLPFFHSSSLFTGLASALQANVPFATRAAVLGVEHDARHPTRAAPRCSPTPARSSTTSWRCRRSPDDATSPVTFAFGNEASEADIREFAGALRLRGARQLRLHRGARRHPARRVDALGRAGQRRRHHPGVRSRHRRGVPACRVRRTGSAA